ncbi:hypothetical protein ACIP46_27195 [Streptomyces lavendulae]|uniref:hypothetical protein n=1 Tax=Streptomyces lavendulae TaxID=1914 RepID=UPI0024A54A93|nr:hypothetical protein [Streptomyces lavendulae]GLW03414.1 hypothetical protein Slala05_70440 [Streptomyces lavendulae subsp. lavendulae]
MSTTDDRVYCGDEGHVVRPAPGRVYVRLAGGPLDGQLLDVTSLSLREWAEGVLLITDRGLYGPGGRALYSPSEADPGGPFRWEGDTP